MVLKTFNVNEKNYKEFSKICKEMEISMSKQINKFMESFVKKEPKARKEYLAKLNKIRKEGKFVKIGTIDDFERKYNLK